MSLSSMPKPHGAILRLSAIAGTLCALGGCIQPLYGPNVAGGTLATEMQAIKVEPIGDRLGHYVENELIFDLNGTGSSPPPKYRLVVVLHERSATPAVNTFYGQAEAGDINVDADYRLLKIAGSDQPITSGSVTQFVTYDRTSQRISNVRAARDAETRNAKVIADQIRTRIAAALAKLG